VLRILIADDHDDLREILKVLIESHEGWHVCAAAVNGLEAVEKAAEVKPDIAILDLSMPEMDGLQAASLISSAAPEVPILIYTNHTFSQEAKLEAKKHGVRDVVSKSAAPQQLLSTVQALENQRPAAKVDKRAEVQKRPASLPDPAKATPSSTDPEGSSVV
jgi:DNA-binding NarL/FixJ family response regulator